MKNLTIYATELKNQINGISEGFTADYSVTSSSYICDMISECADGQVDIYYSDRAEWFAHNWDKVDQANAELGSTGDTMQDIAQAQYLDNFNQLSEDIDNIILIMACEYLIDNGLKELSEEDFDILTDITYEVDNNSRLEEIADYCNENFLNKEAE